MKKGHELVTTGSAGTPDLPCAMVLRLLRALPGVHDILVTVVRKLVACDLDASPGASGPHDLASRLFFRFAQNPITLEHQAVIGYALTKKGPTQNEAGPNRP